MLRLSTSFQVTVAGAALTTAGMAGAGPVRLRDVPQTCKAISQDDLRKAGKAPSVAETLNALPTLPVDCAQPPLPVVQNSGSLTAFERDVLAAHNKARSAVGVPPLRWNPEIAAQEQRWAELLEQHGVIEHRPREGRGNVRENLARVPSNYTIEQTLARWLGEVSDFVPGVFPNVCHSGGDCGGVLHYTQVIWFDTTDIGCGMARGPAFNTIACGYGPGGNKDGEQVGTQEAAAEAYKRWNLEDENVGQFATVADSTRSGAPKGMAINVSEAPNPTVINLLGDGFIYGNIDPQSDADLIINHGDAVMDEGLVYDDPANAAPENPDAAILDKLAAANGPIPKLKPQDEAAVLYDDWQQESNSFRQARDRNDPDAMLKSYSKLAAISRKYFTAYWAAKDQGVDMHRAYDADDMESDLSFLWRSIPQSVKDAPPADQKTAVPQPVLKPGETFAPVSPTKPLDVM